MKIKYILPATALFFLSSCGSNNSAQKDEPGTQEQEILDENCTYSFNPEATEIRWTAYKTTDKIAVTGVFDEFIIDGVKASANNPAGLFKSAKFDIKTYTVNSGNAERDPKLVEFFFKQMDTPESISGKVLNMSDPVNGKGTAELEVTMNNIAQKVMTEYTLSNDTIHLFTEIDMATWNAIHAANKLNEVCKVLHTGADGVSKLWPTVRMEIKSALKKDC
ncbi:MAG TPA: hypothetical protein DDX92_12910 [Flavobacteriales bacterium]|jgi:hypothetical protein|nr:hypothetical protein [Flavobacteriales bacterium]